jgi:hypothetical protein
MIYASGLPGTCIKSRSRLVTGSANEGVSLASGKQRYLCHSSALSILAAQGPFVGEEVHNVSGERMLVVETGQASAEKSR